MATVIDDDAQGFEDWLGVVRSELKVREVQGSNGGGGGGVALEKLDSLWVWF